MKLLTKALENRFKKVGSQEQVADPIVICKFFDPCGYGTWFATEYNPETRTFFGWGILFPDCGELGEFSLDELASVRLKFGLGIERDLWFTEVPLSEAIKKGGY